MIIFIERIRKAVSMMSPRNRHMAKLAEWANEEKRRKSQEQDDEYQEYVLQAKPLAGKIRDQEKLAKWAIKGDL